MARVFASGSSQYLVGAWGGSGLPLTMACWFKATDLTAEHTLMDITDASSACTFWILRAAGAQAGDPVALYVNNCVANSLAKTTAAYTANVWHHACGVVAGITDRRVYLDGANAGTDAVNVSINSALLDAVDIGRSGDSTPGSYLDGMVAEAAIWLVALTAAEVAILAKGYSPLFVRPQSLVRYWPLLRDEDRDIAKYGTSLTANGGPTVGPHPRILYPGRPKS